MDRANRVGTAVMRTNLSLPCLTRQSISKKTLAKSDHARVKPAHDELRLRRVVRLFPIQDALQRIEMPL